MRAIERYILRRILAAFAFGLAVLTGIIWATQALQRLDVVTSKGQTIGLFLELTGLAVPYLATLMAPIALLIAMIAVYDQLNRDSELAVLAGAGASRLTLVRPALFAALLVSAGIAVSGLYVAPLGLKHVRLLITEVRADLISSIVQPGQFIEVEDGLVFHIRDRRQEGAGRAGCHS
jgi:lipopolysaccharide export system permease protein